MRTFLYMSGKFSKVMREVDLAAYNFPWHMQNPATPTPFDGAHKHDAKDFAPLAIFGTIVDNPEMDYETETALPRRIGANIRSLYALQLDYDNGMSIERFIAEHQDLQYSLYTSYSHGTKEGDRFRVVIPLAKELPCELLESRKVRDNLCFNFPSVDECCFHRGHWQLLPLVNPEVRDRYRWHRNKGNPWDFDLDMYMDWAAREEAERVKRMQEAFSKRDANTSERIRNWLVNELGNIQVGAGERYSKVKSLFAWAMNNGLGEGILEIQCPWDDEKWTKHKWPNLVEWACRLG